MPASTAWPRLLFELLDGEAANRSWRGIELAVEPGISALQAAAARAGAPIGHDFCAISLSDLLTPWPVIVRRLRAAAEADFVVAALQPRVKAAPQPARRGAEYPRHPPAARLPRGRRPQSREGGERVDVTTLAGFDAEAVDMLTVIVIGSSQTRRLERADGRGSTRRAAMRRRGGEALRDEERVTVHFIGAGPGAPDLITVRGLTLLRRSPVVLYAGSLVPPMILAEARRVRASSTPPRSISTRSWPRWSRRQPRATRSHDCISGDPSLYGAIAEQMRRLDRLGIPTT